MKKSLLFKILCVILSSVCVISAGGINALADDTTADGAAGTDANYSYTDDYIDDYVYEPSTEYTEAPYDFTYTKFSDSSVTLSWDGVFYDTQEEHGYEVSIVKNDGAYKPVAVSSIKQNNWNEISAVVNGLKSSKEYTFVVRAYAIIGGVYCYGSYSAPVTVCTAPTAAKLKSVTYSSKGKIKVKWSKKKGVSGYLIQYSTSKKFADNGKTVTISVKGASAASKEIGGLAGTTYYVRVCAYRESNGYRFCGKWSSAKSVKVKSGLSVKQLLNSVKTDNSGRKTIKSLTKNGVDIAKYKSTYDKVKAIYNWHAKHYQDFAHCLACNSNFNSCLYALYGDNEKAPDIWIAAGEVKNSDGSRVIHKWSVIYLAGVPYIFDPRLQGYTKNYTGNLYFGIAKGERISKMYIFDEWYGRWSRYSKNLFIS